MARAYSADLRERVVAAVDGGMSCRAAAERFGIGIATAIRWVERRRRTGVHTAKKHGGDRRSHRIEGRAELLLDTIKETPDITLAELRTMTHEKTG